MNVSHLNTVWLGLHCVTIQIHGGITRLNHRDTGSSHGLTTDNIHAGEILHAILNGFI